jgi:hypothetical protein
MPQAKDEDESTIPFPPFEPALPARPRSKPSTNKPGAKSITSENDESSFDPYASGKGYPEFPPDCTNIVRGFPVRGNELPLETMPVRCFPPPSNVIYERAYREHFVERRDEGGRRETGVQRLRIVVPREGWFRELIGNRKENWRVGGKTEDKKSGGGTKTDNGEADTQQPGPLKEKDQAGDTRESSDQILSKNTLKKNLTKGEKLAQNINFRRPAWITTVPGASGPILPADEQRQDFIADINAHGEQLDLCTVCNRRHIPPGPPITLADRDTCGSLLPKWFPAHLVARPWDTYRALINELVALEESSKQDDAPHRDPDRPRWDLEWHEVSPEWVAAGRKEGWWKCRKDEDAPEVERRCRVCHRERERGERRRTVGEDEEMRAERKRVLQGFIDRQVRMFGEVDREVALARIQLESMGMMQIGEERKEEGVREGVEQQGVGREITQDIEEILGSKTRGDTEESSTSGSDSEDGEPGTPKDSPSKKRFFF